MSSHRDISATFPLTIEEFSFEFSYIFNRNLRLWGFECCSGWWKSDCVPAGAVGGWGVERAEVRPHSAGKCVNPLGRDKVSVFHVSFLLNLNLTRLSSIRRQ